MRRPSVTRDSSRKKKSSPRRTTRTRRTTTTPTSSPDPAAEEVLYLEEPLLQFAHGQFATSPHDGLALYGPYSLRQPSHPQPPSYMVIGPPEGIRSMQAWSEAMNRSFAAPQTKAPLLKLHRLWPPYPGFEVAFGSKWSERPTAAFELNRQQLID